MGFPITRSMVMVMMVMMTMMVMVVMMIMTVAGVLSLWGVMEAQVSVGNNDNEHFGATSPTHTSTPVLPDEYQQQAKGDFLFFLVQFWEVD